MDKSTYAILDCITEGVAILDHRFVVIHWNKHLEALTNRTKADVVGKSIFEIFGKLDRAPYKHIFQTTMERGTQHFFSSKIHKQMIVENKYINFKISRVEIGRENGIIVEFTDSTNEHIRVQQLKENVNKLAQLNKELKIKEQEIEKLAYTDHLTGLSNRILFYSFAEKLMASTRRNGSLMGVMFIDVDKFKYINDTYGHQIGDQSLIQTANLIRNNTRETDIVFRFGGDEFLILLPSLDDENSHKKVMDRINGAAKKLKVNGEIEISLSIGVSLYPRDGDDIDQLVLKADQAMYRNKIGKEVFL